MPRLDLRVRLAPFDRPAEMPFEVAREVERIIQDTASEAEELIASEIESVGAYDQGTLIRSVESNVQREVATVTVTAPHAATVDQGRAPGSKPPPAVALLGWMVRHGLDTSQAVGLAIAIGRRGIRARPFLRPAFDKLVDRAPRIIGDAARRIELAWNR